MQRSSVVLVGFSDGYIRGYSKSGQLILSEQLHTDAVAKFSFMSSESQRNNSQVNLYTEQFRNSRYKLCKSMGLIGILPSSQQYPTDQSSDLWETTACTKVVQGTLKCAVLLISKDLKLQVWQKKSLNYLFF